MQTKEQLTQLLTSPCEQARTIVPMKSGMSLEIIDLSRWPERGRDTVEFIVEKYRKHLGIELSTDDAHHWNPSGVVFTLRHHGTVVATGQLADPAHERSDYRERFPDDVLPPNSLEMTRVVATRRTTPGADLL